MEQVRPGAALVAAIRMRMDAKWHTYWKNPGASGMATQVKWQLPEGVTAGEIRWPIPEKLFDEEFTTYVYSDEALLLVPITVASNLPPGALTLKADVSWLECEVACVPGDAKVQVSLQIGDAPREAATAPLIRSWEERVPKDGASLKAVARWQADGTTNQRPFVIEWDSPAAITNADFFPYASEAFEVEAATQSLQAGAGRISIRKLVRKLENWPTALAGVLIMETAAGRQGFEVNLPLIAGGGTGTAANLQATTSMSAGAAAATVPQSLWLMLVYAFLGGLILNIMPCVLPVIALKILSFVGQSKDSPGRIKSLGLLYALGVLTSFMALAGIVIGIKAAGKLAGWGMQFSNPQFLVVLTVIITLVALNLFGLFEVTPGGNVMSGAGQLASRHGAAGAFFNGVLATVLATPCTAPLLGAALGFAFAASTPIILLIFATVAAGLAAPYLFLSFNPSWLRFLPKPGAWMEKFKIAMGFPMLATAFWLLSLIPIHYGERSWWLGIFLVIVGFGAWIYGEFIQRGGRRSVLAWGAIAALLALGYAFVLESQLRWRSPETPTSTGAIAVEAGGVPWQPWSLQAVQAARASGKPVLVDFTAKWCLTCNTIVKPALESASVREKLKTLNAVAFLGDYTLFPKAITEELNRYGRAGVPLVLVFPADATRPAIVLPEALTPSMVLNALEKAAQTNQTSATITADVTR